MFFGTVRIKPLAAALFLTVGLGLLSKWLSGDVRSVYESLTLPPYAPAPGVFPWVWTILFFMIGLASYWIWQSPKTEARSRALTFYAVSLALQFLWMPVFFGLSMFQAAFRELGALFVISLATTGFFAQICPKTLWLMVPYDLWLLFAAVLNRAVAAYN